MTLTEGLTKEQKTLWARVEELWRLALERQADPVRQTLHPDYCGWVTGQGQTHDREAAVASVGPSSPRVLGYRLQPLAVRVFEGTVGVVHYRYTAEIEAESGGSREVSGRWSEVYLRKCEAWLMISVSGGPDGQR